MEVVAKITAERVCCFYWQKIMCRCGLPKVIVFDNGTQFASIMVTEFYRDLGVKMNFVSVVHPQANGQAEIANKVTLNGLKKKFDDVNGLWEELIHDIL